MAGEVREQQIAEGHIPGGAKRRALKLSEDLLFAAIRIDEEKVVRPNSSGQPLKLLTKVSFLIASMTSTTQRRMERMASPVTMTDGVSVGVLACGAAIPAITSLIRLFCSSPW